MDDNTLGLSPSCFAPFLSLLIYMITGYTYGLVTSFDNGEALEHYSKVSTALLLCMCEFTPSLIKQSPEHVKLVTEIVKPNMASILALDIWDTTRASL